MRDDATHVQTATNRGTNTADKRQTERQVAFGKVRGNAFNPGIRLKHKFGSGVRGV